MKRFISLIIILANLLVSHAETGSDSLKISKPVYPFKAGEYLHFVVNYGIMLAGYATIEVHEDKYFYSEDTFKFVTTAKSRRAFDWIFKVRDYTESYFDKENARSLRLEKHLREGSYEVDTIIEYDQDSLKAHYISDRKGKKTRYATIDIPQNVMDPLSALFFVRTLDLSVGKEIIIPATDNKKVYEIKVIVHRIETVKVKAGKFRCFVVEPVMADGGVFKKDGKVMVWLTADDKKMPVRMETKIYIGSIVAELDWFLLK
jgi:hypothetical protein